jgi:hypothetical protein
MGGGINLENDSRNMGMGGGFSPRPDSFGSFKNSRAYTTLEMSRSEEVNRN